nr:heparan-alpha-glucosaminide N-acetyltransferase domain-containing protein [uncultured Flavobacterium sp.]
MKRIQSIDIIRGLVMIIMALDHVRDLMHLSSITQSPTNLETTTPILFFTRWITHLCAPIFVFLAGTSAYISLKSKNNISVTKSHLLKRGLSLLLLEFTVVNFAIFFDVGFHTILFQVIASTGFGFIILSLLLKLPPKQLGFIGLLIIFCHNLAPLIPFAETSIFKFILMPFFSPTAIPLFAGKVFVMGYPPIPWLGIMLVGFATGQYFLIEEVKRKKMFINIGLIALVLFIAIRFLNIYGDSLQWTYQKSKIFTILSFLNVTKYPPSLVFCLVTLGIMFLLLAYAENFSEHIKKITMVYGKVPLLFFVVHFYLIHIITIIVLFIQGFHFSQLEFATGTFGRPKGIESGLQLWTIYVIWIAVVAALYKPCIWFGQYKASHKNWWLKYT